MTIFLPTLKTVFQTGKSKDYRNISWIFYLKYIENTIHFIKTDLAEYVLSINSFHHNIEFPYETEVNSKLTFLDILLLKEDQNITPTVYKKVKKSKSDTSLNWNSFCRQSLKREALTSLVQRAHLTF